MNKILWFVLSVGFMVPIFHLANYPFFSWKNLLLTGCLIGLQVLNHEDGVSDGKKEKGEL